jgi:hypothetical protein
MRGVEIFQATLKNDGASYIFADKIYRAPYFDDSGVFHEKKTLCADH